MSRKSSIHFKPVINVRFSVSHAERTDLSEPAYLLPKEHQLPNIVVSGSLSENELAALFIQQKERMSRQAKTAGASPFWEGVVVLSDTDSKTQSENLQVWKVAYEKATGHKVLHMSIHLDEGYIDATGKPQYNPHAHVIVSRMDEKNRVIHLDRKQLAAVQDLTAEHLKMERGSTLEDRQGKRGRAHIPHREYREIADGARLDLDGEKDKTAFEAKLTDSLSANLKQTKAQLKEVKAVAGKVPSLEAKVGQQAQQIADLAIKHTAEIAAIHEQNRIARQALKDSGIAKQKDYQAQKIIMDTALAEAKTAHVKEVSDLKTALAEALVIVEKVPQLEAQIRAQGAEIARLNEQYRIDREEFKRLNAEAAAAGQEKVKSQKDYSELKKALESTQAEAAKVPLLETQATELAAALSSEKEAHAVTYGQALEIQDGLEKALVSLATEAKAPAPVAPTQQNMLVEAPKPVEPVFPRLTEAEFRELPKQKLSDRVVDAAKDVLVWGVGLAEAAAKQKIFPPSLVKALEKLLANYITPEPPAPKPVKATPAARTVAPGRSGVSR